MEEPDCNWNLSNHQILELQRTIESLEQKLAEAHRRAASVETQLGHTLIRSGQFEAAYGVEMMRRWKR